jgi:peptidylprolyl isomerase
MSQVKTGDRVRFNFVGKLDDGTIFDSSDEHHDHDDDCGCDGDGPLEFIVGEEEILPSLEQAVIGMNLGEKRTVKLSPAEAYGERSDEHVVTVPRSDLPEDIEPEEDQVLEMVNDEDESFPVWITEVTDTTVTLDANHPLAGETLTFEMELIDIVPAH